MMYNCCTFEIKSLGLETLIVLMTIFGSGVLNPGAVFLRFVTKAFLQFLALVTNFLPRKYKV